METRRKAPGSRWNAAEVVPPSRADAVRLAVRALAALDKASGELCALAWALEIGQFWSSVATSPALPVGSG